MESHLPRCCANAAKRLHNLASAIMLNGAMNPMTQAEEMLRRFNEDEAVWRCYERKRSLRKLLGSHCPLSEEALEYLDWLAAERECRRTHHLGTIGFPVERA